LIRHEPNSLAFKDVEVTLAKHIDAEIESMTGGDEYGEEKE
jgi:hypothetical protein